MVRGVCRAADIPGVSLPPTDPHAAVRRRAALARSVGAVTQLTTVVALTSTGGIVGVLAHEARQADALSHEPAASPRVVVASPVARPVRTVVVRRPAVVRPVPQAQAPKPRARQAQPAVRKPRQARTSSGTQTRPAPAPRATQAPPATKSSGS